MILVGKISKKKKNIIIIGIVILIILCVSIILFLINKNKSDSKEYEIEKSDTIKFGDDYIDPSIVDVVSDTLINDHCEEGICVSVTKISCNKKIGTIYYKVTNVGSSKNSGYLMISFGKNDIYLMYNNIDIGESYESFHNYKNKDLSKVTDFKLKLLDDSYSKKYHK